MIAIDGVQVPVVGIVDVVAVQNRLVSAVGAVHMGVAGMCQVREWMLVVVALVRRVRVSLVHIVDMPLALGACMPTAWPVHVVVIVKVMFAGCHRSSLLC
jgi:hypothetical protein